MPWTSADVAAHYRRHGADPLEAVTDGRERRNKYGVSPKEERTCDGIVFTSKREMQHYQALKCAADMGAIADLQLQPEYVLQEAFTDADGKRHRRIVYRADFSFRRSEEPDALVVVDVKGMKTQAYQLKVKLFRQRFPKLRFEEWS